MNTNFGRTWDPLVSLQNAIEAAMGQNFFGLATSDQGVFPAISVFKGENELLLTAELPGVRKEDISVEVKNDLFRIFGERKIDFDPKEVSTHRRERPVGVFDRTLKLPFAVNADMVQATYEEGILRVNLPFAESAKTKKVKIS